MAVSDQRRCNGCGNACEEIRGIQSGLNGLGFVCGRRSSWTGFSTGAARRSGGGQTIGSRGADGEEVSERWKVRMRTGNRIERESNSLIVA